MVLLFYHGGRFMSLDWRRNGEEVEELATGPCNTMQPLNHYCLTGSLENTYFQHQALICGSELSSAPHDFPSETSQLHCITIIPTSSLQQVPEHHPALISTGNQQGTVPSSSWLSPRQQVCSLWHEWRSFSDYPF